MKAQVVCSLLAVALAISCSNSGNQDASSFENGDKISSSSSSVQNSSSSINLMPCGSGFFNSATQFCLNGNTITELCGGDAYSIYQFCANDKVYDLCGGIGYNPANYICCNNVQYDINTYECCNNKQYFLATQFCSENSVLNKCGGIEYNPVNQRCENNVIENKCGNNWHNPLMQFCYGNNIFDKCSGSEYNSATQFCNENMLLNKCGGETYNPVTQFCNENGILNKCGGETYNPTMKFCNENMLLNKCSGNEYNPANQRCENNVIEGKCGSDWYNPSVLFCSENYILDKCGGYSYNPKIEYCFNGTIKSYGTLTDNRDVVIRTYKTVVIGTQTWMAENLNHYNSNGYNSNNSRCYDYLDSNCAKYGRLYDWAMALTICPSGWHLPSDAEWRTLTSYIGGSSIAGKKLRAINGWNSYYDGRYNGTDDYGFAALPGGACDNGVFDYKCYHIGNEGRWWSALEVNNINAYDVEMKYDEERAMHTFTSRPYLLSVRCVKDQ